MTVQLVVTYADHSIMYYPVSAEAGGWKIEAASRCVVIGRGMGRTYVPLDNVLSFSVEEYGSTTEPSVADQSTTAPPRCPFCDHMVDTHSALGCRYICPCLVPQGEWPAGDGS